mgnify:CR=1 FL=1
MNHPVEIILVSHLEELGASLTWLSRGLKGKRFWEVSPNWEHLKEALAACSLAHTRLLEGEPEKALEALASIHW